MSEENVEIVRGYLEAYDRRSPEEVAEWVEKYWDPDGNLYTARKLPESRPQHGREEISRFFADFRGTWDRFEYQIWDVVPVGDDRVLAHTTLSAEGRESGAKIEGDIYQCFWLRHGRIIRQEQHLTAAGALHALGLEGESLEAAGLRE